MQSYGKHLKELRLKADLSQGDITRALGYKANQYVSDWERGRSPVPLSKIRPLAKLLKIKPKDLLLICYPEIKDILNA